MGVAWKVYDTVEHRVVALKQFFRKLASPGTGKLAKTKQTSKATADVDTSLNVTEAGVREPLVGDDIFATTAAQTKRAKIAAGAASATEVDLQFKQEFRTMVKLKHPNTVHVYDFGVLEDSNPYITMEIVLGRELRDILKERRLTIPEVYRIFMQTAQVLNFIHSRLLVHRDIKPDNIRITPEGNVKMMDFGLMEQMGNSSTGEITGTPLYLPPEVTKGGVIDARSDLYSLGIMAYELATGKLPFSGKTILEIIKKHIEQPPAPPCKIRKDIPAELEKIILKLIAKEPDNRYQTTMELINDLAKFTGQDVSTETLEQRKSYLNCSELIGREKEMRELKEHLKFTKESKGQSVFVAAPAGVGKSRLIQEAKLTIQLAEIPFMQGQCFEQAMTPYQPLADAFKPLLPLTKQDILDRHGSILVKVIPELKNKGYHPAPPLEEFAERARLFESVTGWLKEISKITPVVIYIEDLHWSDMASIDLLNACIRTLRMSPVMILSSFRDDEVDSTNRIFQTAEEELTKIMKLSPLNSKNVETLIKRMLGRIELTEDFSEQIYNATGGNPFFVTEAMRTLIEEEQLKLDRGRWILPADISALELPTSIEATITRRLNLLSPDALSFARFSAVVGRNLDLSFLKQLGKLGDTQLFDILDELTERQFVKIEEKRYAFTHDRVRETLYAQLTEEDRQKLHEQVGNLLEVKFAHNKALVINELAYHFNRGLDKTKAVDYLIQAGYSLRESSDVVGASKSFIRALEILDKIDYPNKKTVALHARDRLLEWTYITDPAFALEMAQRQFYELNSLVPFFSMLIKLFRCIFKVVDRLPKRLSIKVKMKLARQTPKKKIEGDLGTILRFTILSLVWWCLGAIFSGKTEKSLEAAELFDKYVPDFDGPGFAMLTAGSVALYQYIGKTVTFRKKLEHSLKIFEEIKHYTGFSETVEKYCYGALLFEGSVNDALMGKNYNRELISRGLNYSEKEKFFDQVIWCYITRQVWLCDRGMYKNFKEEIAQPRALLKKMGRPPAQEAWLYMFSAKLEILMHCHEKAVEDVDKLYNTTSKIGYSYLLTIAKGYRALFTFKRGEKESGLAQIKEVIAQAAEANFVTHTEFTGYLAEMYLELDDIAQAELAISQAEQFMENFEEPHSFAKARLHLLSCEVARRKRKFEDAQKTLEKVIAVSEETSNPFLEAEAAEQKAKIFIDLSKRSSAKDSLDEAKLTYEQLGAEKRVKEIEELLKTIKE
ncbi:protein kinase [Candidatus Omnitrophota bacterium]